MRGSLFSHYAIVSPNFKDKHREQQYMCHIGGGNHRSFVLLISAAAQCPNPNPNKRVVGSQNILTYKTYFTLTTISGPLIPVITCYINFLEGSNDLMTQNSIL